MEVSIFKTSFDHSNETIQQSSFFKFGLGVFEDFNNLLKGPLDNAVCNL